MVRTSVTPRQQNISITVPPSYVGKKVEVMLYALEELEGEAKETVPKSNAARFKGIFSKEEGKMFNEYQKQARDEWDRDI
jgi:hypothetical protein